MASPSIEDRRRTSRRWAAVPVSIRHREARIDGVSINLSEGGMYLFAAAHLPLGCQIQLEFRPPESERAVCICGVVRRRALYLYGIEFLGEDSAPCREDAHTDRSGNPSCELEAL